MSRWLFAVALLAVSFAAAPHAALAAGTFSITPSRRDVAGRPPVTLAPTQVRNTTGDSYDVRVFPVLLRQGLSGAFQFDETQRPLNAARTILDVTPSRFRLAPGGSREVALRWHLLPLSSRAAYVGIVFQGQARTRDGRSVPVISRLLSINFLRLPGRYRRSGEFTALSATQLRPRALSLLARVKNTGNAVGSPSHGRITINDSTGRRVYRARWRGDVILPKAQRDFPIDLRRVLPAGTYKAHVAMRFGASRREKIVDSFTLAGPGQLAAPRVKVSELGSQGEVGGRAKVTARVRNSGTAAAGLDLSLSLFAVRAGQPRAAPLASGRIRISSVAAGGGEVLQQELGGKLASGQYRVLARYRDEAGALQELTSDFEATRHRGLLERLRLFADRNAVLIAVVLAAFAIAVFAFVLLRRQRRLEAELQRLRALRDDG